MMQSDSVIVITGAAGFIGSYMAGYLNNLGFNNLVLVDDFSDKTHVHNLQGKKFIYKVHREQFFDWILRHPGMVNHIFHLGARTDTTEMDYKVHKKWNLDYSKMIWEVCVQENISLVYASSAATYGDGSLGYNDEHDLVAKLHPLNAYGRSKNDFDLWALEQKHMPPFWAGVKFFNVFGPNEYHKGRMASVVFHAYHQAKEKGVIKLFRSHKKEYKDGEQQRDFIYVSDIVRICAWLMTSQPQNGLYNAGSGSARSYNDLAKAIFTALAMPVHIEYIDTPKDIRDKYQYFTEAAMQKLRAAGYQEPFASLEENIHTYVKEYLEKGSYF